MVMYVTWKAAAFERAKKALMKIHSSLRWLWEILHFKGRDLELVLGDKVFIVESKNGD
jgi:hypothetical protein